MKANRFLYINGRFMEQPVTGLQRYALEVSKRLMDSECLKIFGDVNLVTNPTKNPTWLQRNLWEQSSLLIKTMHGTLFSPCNVGPWLHPHHLVVMHDMRAFDTEFGSAFSASARAYLQATGKVLSKTAEHIFTVSHFSKAKIVKEFRIKEEKVTVVYPGADHILEVKEEESIISRLSLTPGKFILAVNSLLPHKNLALLHSVDWKQFGLQLCIVGDEPKKRPRQGEMEEKSIRYAGRVSDSEVKSLYARALAFVFPSFYEGFGIPPLEAMYCGCPVIASNRTSIPEVCGNAALYFDPSSGMSLEGEVARLIADKSLRMAMIDKGYQRASAFRWDTTAGELAFAINQFTGAGAAKI